MLALAYLAASLALVAAAPLPEASGDSVSASILAAAGPPKATPSTGKTCHADDVQCVVGRSVPVATCQEGDVDCMVQHYIERRQTSGGSLAALAAAGIKSSPSSNSNTGSLGATSGTSASTNNQPSSKKTCRADDLECMMGN